MDSKFDSVTYCLERVLYSELPNVASSVSPGYEFNC